MLNLHNETGYHDALADAGTGIKQKLLREGRKKSARPPPSQTFHTTLCWQMSDRSTETMQNWAPCMWLAGTI